MEFLIYVVVEIGLKLAHIATDRFPKICHYFFGILFSFFEAHLTCFRAHLVQIRYQTLHIEFLSIVIVV